jgi:hypothetical protein
MPPAAARATLPRARPLSLHLPSWPYITAIRTNNIAVRTPHTPHTTAVESFRWSGPAPGLWLDHGHEQRRVELGAAVVQPSVRVPFVPSKPLPLLVRLIRWGGGGTCARLHSGWARVEMCACSGAFSAGS